jgi:hypothetical protein
MTHRTARMIKLGSNLLAVVLVTVMATVSVAGQGAPLMVAAHPRPAGCHQHGTAPVPQPVSYHCCQSGHDSAILQISLTSQLDSAGVTAVGHSLHIQVPDFTHQSLRTLATSSADPPDITPLRI